MRGGDGGELRQGERIRCGNKNALQRKWWCLQTRGPSTANELRIREAHPPLRMTDCMELLMKLDDKR
jgi:hypothetical protein